MEYLFGFIAGLIFTHITCGVIYLCGINETKMIYERRIRELKGIINEYNRQ